MLGLFVPLPALSVPCQLKCLQNCSCFMGPETYLMQTSRAGSGTIAPAIHVGGW